MAWVRTEYVSRLWRAIASCRRCTSFYGHNSHDRGNFHCSLSSPSTKVTFGSLGHDHGASYPGYNCTAMSHMSPQLLTSDQMVSCDWSTLLTLRDISARSSLWDILIHTRLVSAGAWVFLRGCERFFEQLLQPYHWHGCEWGSCMWTISQSDWAWMSYSFEGFLGPPCEPGGG